MPLSASQKLLSRLRSEARAASTKLDGKRGPAVSKTGRHEKWFRKAGHRIECSRPLQDSGLDALPFVQRKDTGCRRVPPRRVGMLEGCSSRFLPAPIS